MECEEKTIPAKRKKYCIKCKEEIKFRFGNAKYCKHCATEKDKAMKKRCCKRWRKLNKDKIKKYYQNYHKNGK